MQSTKLLRDKHNQLIALGEELDQELKKRKAKMRLSTAKIYDQLDDEVMELEQLQRDYIRFLVSYQSTFELE